MLFSKPIGEFMDGLREFLADEASIALELEVKQEFESHAARMLDAVAEEQNDLLVPLEVRFGLVSEVCSAIALELGDVVTQAGGVFGDHERTRFNLPSQMTPATERFTDEVCLLEYVETISRALSHHVRRLTLVLALRIEHGRANDCAAFLTRLLVRSGTTDLKWIFLVSSGLGLERELTQLRRCPHVVHEAGFSASLERWMRDPATRVGTMRDAAVLRGVRKNHHLVGTDFLAVMIDDIPYANRTYYFTEAARSLTRQCLKIELREGSGKHVRPLFEEAHELAGYHEAEIHFAELCERLLKAMLKDDQCLLIVLAPDPKRPVEGLGASVDVLARGAASARVKYLILDPRLSERFDRKGIWKVSRLRYRFEPEQIEQQMAERLESVDCSAVEKSRLMTALASTAMAKGDPEAAIAHSLAALEVARECEAPAETTTAWYGLATTLYQCAAFEPAERAYAECVDRALDEAREAMAAQAMSGLGHTYFMRQRSDQAIEFYVTARRLWRKQRNTHGEVYALTWQAESAAQKGDFTGALAHLGEAIALCERTHPGQEDAYRAARAELLQRKATVHAKANQPQEEQVCLAEAECLGATLPASDHP